MPCYKPHTAYNAPGGSISFSPRGTAGVKLQLPCGQCIGCRVDRKTEWALRLTHEMKCHKVACFITLTYDDEHLPRGGTLVKRHAQLFMKSLRDKYRALKIRFFLCGEYGDRTQRAHYHAIIFGWRPTDGRVFKYEKNYTVYTSAVLAELWSRGHVSWTEASEWTCRYVAGYAVKKVVGQKAKEHYTRVTLDGEMIELQPEFATQSRRPGIGAHHYGRFVSDFRNGDTAVLGGRKKKIPRYYDKLFERAGGDLEAVKRARKVKARKHAANNTPERLAVREAVSQAKAKLRRTIL